MIKYASSLYGAIIDESTRGIVSYIAIYKGAKLKGAIIGEGPKIVKVNWIIHYYQATIDESNAIKNVESVTAGEIDIACIYIACGKGEKTATVMLDGACVVKSSVDVIRGTIFIYQPG